MSAPNAQQPDPSSIMQVGLGFWPSKVLLTAVNEGLFTHLAERPHSLMELKKLFGWNCTNRHASDFLDTLFALKFLQRQGIGDEAVYSNTTETGLFLDKNKQSYIGGILEMANNRLFRFWANLDEGLRTGEAQNEIRQGGENMFEALYKSPELLRGFINAMSGISIGNFHALAKKFDFSKYKTLCDIGGAGGMLSIQVAKENPHISCTSFDLPEVEPIAKEIISKFGLQDKIKTAKGNFFADPFPKADIITMGLILHDWNEEKKLKLIKKAYDALPENGAFVAIENIIDNERSKNVFGLTMSLNMLIETSEGFDFTMDDFSKWTKATGFKSVELLPLAGPTSAAIAYK
jgi:hypothetical protein